MRKLITALLLIPSVALASSVEESFTISIQNENSTVSPGGILAFKITGSTTNESGKGSGSYYYYESSDSINSFEGSYSYYHSSEYVTHPRYNKAYIDPSLSALPRTEEIRMTRNGKVVARATFYIKEGSRSYTPTNERNKYAVDIEVKPDKVGHWYEIYCISSATGFCSIDIKNGVIDKHNGRPARIAKHNCSDRGYPGGSRLDVGSSLIFDASKMMQQYEGTYTPPHGHSPVNSAACLFISDAPLMLRPIDKKHLAKLRK